MRDYLTGVAKFFGIVAFIPICIGFIGAWSAGLGFVLFVFGIPCGLLLLAIGGIAWTVRAVKFARQTTDARMRLGVMLIAPVCVVLICSAGLPLLAAGSFAGNLSRLAANRTHYEAIIAKARTSRIPAWFADDRGVTYSVDLGPPVRVAFNPAGMLDNWSGIIFDPTGDVMLAHGFDLRTGKFHAPDRITKLFEGDLVSCRHLWGDYYHCSFT
jgi:hypothetical protein